MTLRKPPPSIKRTSVLLPRPRLLLLPLPLSVVLLLPLLPLLNQIRLLPCHRRIVVAKLHPRRNVVQVFVFNTYYTVCICPHTGISRVVSAEARFPPESGNREVRRYVNPGAGFCFDHPHLWKKEITNTPHMPVKFVCRKKGAKKTDTMQSPAVFSFRLLSGPLCSLMDSRHESTGCCQCRSLP